MPVVDGVGFGECTKIKIEHFSRIIAMHIAITRAVLNKNCRVYKNRYRYIELTAGPGISPTGEKGSPIAFLEQANLHSRYLQFQADLIENKPENLRKLRTALESEQTDIKTENVDLVFYGGNYQSIIPQLFPQVDFEFGLVFVDPTGKLPDFKTLQYIAKMRPKMEILMYLSSTNIKRVFQYTGKHLEDYLISIGKPYWLIRREIQWDKHQWTFLLGSDTDIFKGYSKIGLYRLNTRIGQAILKRLNYSEKEQMERIQPGLGI